jgi:hypothetical protein
VTPTAAQRAHLYGQSLRPRKPSALKIEPARD